MGIPSLRSEEEHAFPDDWRLHDMAIDSLVVKYMTEEHFNGIKPTNKQIEEFYDRFGTWRYLAYWMEFIVNQGWSPDAQ